MTEIKEHLRDYLEEVAEYKPKDHHWTCPICKSGTRGKGSDGALTFYESTLSWYCHSCHRGGTIIDMHMMLHKVDDRTAISELSSKYGITQKKEKATKPKPQKREHIYHTADGAVFAKKVISKDTETGKKSVIWYRYDGSGYKIGLNGAKAPLYDLHELAATKDKCIFICEGEKDAETLKSMGFVATSKPESKGFKWTSDQLELFNDKHVAILTDNDEAGEECGTDTLKAIFGRAEKAVIVPATAILSNVPEKGDISDIVSTIGVDAAKAALLAAAKAAPETMPPIEETDQDETEDMLTEFKTADQFQPEPITWLWRGRIPMQYITFLMSPGGCGKSFLSAVIAAAVSTGRALPDGGQIERGKVLYLSAEDSGAIVRERLESCEADLSKIIIQDIDAEHPLMFPDTTEDANRIAQWCKVLDAHRPKLVICDVWHAFTSPDIDLNRQNSVRAVLRAVAKLAKSYNTAFLLLAHTSKRRQETNLNDALLGSSDTVNAARSVLMVVTDSDSGEKALIHTKSNLSELAPSLEFQIDSEGLTFGGFSKITKAVCEEAARKRCTPWELLALKEKHREDDSELLQTLAELAQIGKTVAITYDEVEEAGGSMIWGGSQPKKALERLRKPDLLSRGISISEIGKRIKRHDKTVRGFMLSCNTTSEEIAGALPK